MTDSEKLDDITKRLKRVEISSDIHTIINILIFLGIASVGALITKVKNKI